MFHEKIIKKIPGEPVRPSRKESQGYVDNLEDKRTFELRDLLARQNKLLDNKRFVAKLPDKGEKIVKFRDAILKEIEHRDEMDQAANLLSRLNIAAEGKAAMSALEWTGKYDEKSLGNKVIELDSDDEEDPLKILAQPTGTGVHAKKIIIVQPEESLIKPDDLAEIESFKTEKIPSDAEHVKYIVDIVENPENEKHRQSFKPYKTTKTDVHDPMKEKVRKKDKHWEITAATPPLIVHGAVKSLSLHESLKLQKDQADKLQEIQAKHAIERLTQQIGRHNIGALSNTAGNYRTHDKDSDSSSSDEEEEQEVHDDEDNDKAGTVVFTVDSIEV